MFRPCMCVSQHMLHMAITVGIDMVVVIKEVKEQYLQLWLGNSHSVYNHSPMFLQYP